MSSSCPRPAVLAAFDSLAGDSRRDVLVHAAACGACRARLLQDDPARVFALLALEAVAPEALRAVSTAVAERLTAQSAPRRRWAVVAGWAAAAVLAIVVARTLRQPWHPDFGAAPETAAVSGPRAGVEVLSPADPRQIVDITVGDSQVVMIFDERLRL